MKICNICNGVIGNYNVNERRDIRLRFDVDFCGCYWISSHPSYFDADGKFHNLDR